MIGAEYFGTSISPYLLNQDALSLIGSLEKSFSREHEEKATILLNAAELHPKMSKYQLSLAHKQLADVYYKRGIFGSALAHYSRGLELNPSLSVKRRIKELSALSGEKLAFSASPDLVANVLDFPKYKKIVEEERAEAKRERDRRWAGDNARRAAYEKARAELREKAKRDNAMIAPDYEDEIQRRLEAMGEPYISEFQRLRAQFRLFSADDVLSLREQELLTLAAMERSFKYRGR